MTRTHTLIKRSSRIAIGSVPLRKRAPIEVFVTSTRIAPGFRSQEHRRPRFSFLLLHNVKEQTLQPKPGERLKFQNPTEGNPPGLNRHQSQPVRFKRQTVGATQSLASSAPRYLSQTKPTVNTVFRFSFCQPSAGKPEIRRINR